MNRVLFLNTVWQQHHVACCDWLIDCSFFVFNNSSDTIMTNSASLFTVILIICCLSSSIPLSMSSPSYSTRWRRSPYQVQTPGVCGRNRQMFSHCYMCGRLSDDARVYYGCCSGTPSIMNFCRDMLAWRAVTSLNTRSRWVVRRSTARTLRHHASPWSSAVKTRTWAIVIVLLVVGYV